MELMQTILASLSELIPPSVTNLTQKQFFSWHAVPIWISAFHRALKSRPSPIKKHSVGFIEPQSIFFPHNNKHKPKQTTMNTVRVNNGRVEEFENGSLRKTYGSNITAAATDGQTVAAVTRAGRIETYVNGSMRQTFGSNALSVQVSGDTVVVQTSNGRTEEYVNGSMRRTY
jgi:hypothetical protein